MAEHLANLDRLAADGPTLLYIAPVALPLGGHGSKMINITGATPATQLTDRDRALLAALLTLALQRLTQRTNPTTKD